LLTFTAIAHAERTPRKLNMVSGPGPSKRRQSASRRPALLYISAGAEFENPVQSSLVEAASTSPRHLRYRPSRFRGGILATALTPMVGIAVDGVPRSGQRRRPAGRR
jgi:hypothetical protein